MREMGNWNEYFIEYLATDHEAAIDYLQLTLEEYLTDDDLPFFLKCLQTFVASQGGVIEISKRTGIDPNTLSNMFAHEDATGLLDMFSSLLDVLKHRPVIEDTHADHLSPMKQIPTNQ